MKTIIPALLIASLLSSCAGVPTRQTSQDWSPEVNASVQTGKITLGMTQDQVKAAWGRPDLTHRSLSSLGEVEVWQYGTYHYTCKKYWLTFVNGKLVRFRE